MGASASINSDPWTLLTDIEMMTLLKEQDGESLIIESLDSLDSLKVQSTIDPIRLIAENIDINDDNIKSVDSHQCLTQIRSRIVSLNLSGNELTGLELNQHHSLQVRQLIIGGNPLNPSLFFPKLKDFSNNLLDLDLSYTSSLKFNNYFTNETENNDIEDENENVTEKNAPFASIGKTLIRLNLTCCELTNINYILNGLIKLKELILSENDLENLEETSLLIQQTIGLTIIELDLSDNPFIDQNPSLYKQYFIINHNKFPLLQIIDNRNIQMTSNIINHSISHLIDDNNDNNDVDNRGRVEILGDAPAMAALEAEVNASLKGHQDNTVIA